MIRGDFQASAWLDLNVCTRALRGYSEPWLLWMVAA